MADRTPFEFDMRVSADKKRRKTGRRGMSGAVESTDKPCDFNGCSHPGQYRAPKSPERLDDWFWFCKDHIREYNLKWNFFQGTTDAEFQDFLAKDRVWGRATQPFGNRPDEGRAWARLGMEDAHGVLGDKATLNPGRAHLGRHPQAARDRAQGAGDPGCPRHLDAYGNPQTIQEPGEGSSPGHEWRRPQGRRAFTRGRLGLGPDQGKPPLPRLTVP
jgi:hypothetical protein